MSAAFLPPGVVQGTSPEILDVEHNGALLARYPAPDLRRRTPHIYRNKSVDWAWRGWLLARVEGAA